jgi:hypothetical protein
MQHKYFSVRLGIVKSVDTINRLISVNFTDSCRGANNVIVVDSFGNYSFPKIDDIVLILHVDSKNYAIGKIESTYAQQILGNFKDPTTKTQILAKEVESGSVYLNHIIQSIGLAFENSGDFSLKNIWQDGFAYTLAQRLTELIGNSIHLLSLGSNVFIKLGAVLRDIPTQGTQIISTNGLPALEIALSILNNSIKFVRFQLGHVIDALGTEETSSFGNKLRAILEVCNAIGSVVGTINIDESGNIEIKSTDNKVVLNGNTSSGILLSGLTSSQSAVRGEKLLDWLKDHTHPTSTGPSGKPLLDPTLPIFEILSNQVKLD